MAARYPPTARTDHARSVKYLFGSSKRPCTNYVYIGRQDLNYTILDLDSYEVIQRGKVPLAKNATLRWIGFSAENLPCIYDSTGLLSVLDRARRPMQARWVPLLDTNTLARREGKQESYWPIGVNDASFMCIILKVRMTLGLMKPCFRLLNDVAYRERRSTHTSLRLLRKTCQFSCRCSR